MGIIFLLLGCIAIYFIVNSLKPALSEIDKQAFDIFPKGDIIYDRQFGALFPMAETESYSVVNNPTRYRLATEEEVEMMDGEPVMYDYFADDYIIGGGCAPALSENLISENKPKPHQLTPAFVWTFAEHKGLKREECIKYDFTARLFYGSPLFVCNIYNREGAKLEINTFKVLEDAKDWCENILTKLCNEAFVAKHPNSPFL